MKSNPNKIKIKDWNHLKEISVKLTTTEEQYIVPMGAYGLESTKVILDADDEIKQILKYHDDNKNSTAGTIVLIGTEY